jgi:hypothetical protein
MKTSLPQRRNLSLKKKFIFSIFSFFLLLVFTEGLLYTFKFKLFPRTYVGQFQNKKDENFLFDPQVGWKMLPNHTFTWKHHSQEITYTSDANGFRKIVPDLEIPPSLPQKKIVFLGDSFTWGFGVKAEETFSFLLAQSLKNYSIYNLAMPSFGTDQIALSLKFWALPLKPDLIIIVLFEEDFERNFHAYRNGYNKPTFLLEKGKLRQATPQDSPSAFWIFLENHSRLFSLIYKLQQKFNKTFGYGNWWKLNKALLEEMNAEGNKERIPLLFIYIPDKKRNSFPALNRYMEENKYPYIDFSKKIQNTTQNLYLEDDPLGHFNKEGHFYLKEILLEWGIPQLFQR